MLMIYWAYLDSSSNTSRQTAAPPVDVAVWIESKYCYKTPLIRPMLNRKDFPWASSTANSTKIRLLPAHRHNHSLWTSLGNSNSSIGALTQHKPYKHHTKTSSQPTSPSFSIITSARSQAKIPPHDLAFKQCARSHADSQ